MNRHVHFFSISLIDRYIVLFLSASYVGKDSFFLVYLRILPFRLSMRLAVQIIFLNLDDEKKDINSSQLARQEQQHRDIQIPKFALICQNQRLPTLQSVHCKILQIGCKSFFSFPNNISARVPNLVYHADLSS